MKNTMKNSGIKTFYDDFVNENNPNFYEEYRWHSSRYNAAQYWDTFQFLEQHFAKGLFNNISKMGKSVLG